MAEIEKPIYLIVDFNWPKPLTKEVGQMVKKLHELVEESN